ncbi:MAG: tetratricopeptide repeat protein [Ignavibacteria bacterium]|nr:tetratricopeptide repeat protein [Ignavibacteria bacterium]
MAEQRDFDKLWNYDDPAGTEAKFRELLPKAEKAKDTAYYIELLTQLARTRGLQRKFDEAHEILDKAMKLITAEHIVPRIRFMLERGRTYNSSKVYDKARELFLAAYMQADKYEEDNLAIDAVHMLGIVDKDEESLKWNELAIQMAEDTEDEKAKGWLGALYNNTGWTYHDMGEFDKALELFERNVVWHTERKSGMQLYIAKWSVARCLRSLGRTEEALKMQMDLRGKDSEMYSCEDGYNAEEIAECLHALGRAEDARPYFKRAYEQLSKDSWVMENDKEKLERLKTLGE